MKIRSVEQTKQSLKQRQSSQGFNSVELRVVFLFVGRDQRLFYRDTSICGYPVPASNHEYYCILNSLFFMCVFVLCALGARAQVSIADSCDISGGNSPSTGFGTNGVNYQLGARLSGTNSSGLSYLQTATTKAASSYSIDGNKI